MKHLILLACSAILLACSQAAELLAPAPEPCPSGTLHPLAVSLAVGDSAQLVSTVRCGSGDNRMFWSSSDQSIVAVETRTDTTAMIFGIGTGEAIVTAYPAADPPRKGQISVEVVTGAP